MTKYFVITKMFCTFELSNDTHMEDNLKGAPEGSGDELKPYSAKESAQLLYKLGQIVSDLRGNPFVKAIIREETAQLRQQMKKTEAYKLLFYMTQAGWTIDVAQQPFSTTLRCKIPGIKEAARVIILWDQMEYRSVGAYKMGIQGKELMRDFGLTESKLPNQ